MDERRRRGRPRSYDPDLAIERATEVFWGAGYAASSLDALSAAMDMNRPSLYGAFGDKETLYLTTLERYRDEGLKQMREALDPQSPLRDGLAAFYARALDIYYGGDAARGCFLVGTATVEAVRNPAVREMLRVSLEGFDRTMEDRLRLAVGRGELAPSADTAALATLATGIMYSLAVRSRAGEPRARLEMIAHATVDMICGPAVAAA
jgi:AcrR family transcriptional regulator